MSPPKSRFSLRPATAVERFRIRRLVRGARLNPTGLRWQRFLVAVAPDGQVIGCAQIKPHADGSRELASVVVDPAWRGRGVARALIKRLLETNTPPLYLTCRAALGDFYARFGFHTVPREEMPRYFRRIARLAGFVDVPLLVMRWDGDRLSGVSGSWRTPPAR